MELHDWLRWAEENGSSFLRTTAEAALLADLKHYNLLRPVLLELKKEWPKPALRDSMCGRYRLSRRKQIIEEHFDSVSGDEDWSSSLQHRPDPADPSHPPESEGARPRIVADPLGSHSLMGERLVCRRHR